MIHLGTLSREIRPQVDGVVMPRDEYAATLFEQMLTSSPSYPGRSVYVTESYFDPALDAHRLVLHHFYDARDEDPIHPGLRDAIEATRSTRPDRTAAIAQELVAATPPIGGPTPGLEQAYAELDAATGEDHRGSGVNVSGISWSAELSTVIGESIGAASMLWGERPRGIFDDVAGRALSERLLLEIERRIAKAERAAKSEGLHEGSTLDVESGRQQRDVELIREAVESLASSDRADRRPVIEVAGVPFMAVNTDDVVDKGEQILLDAGIEPPRVVVGKVPELTGSELRAVCVECEGVISGREVDGRAGKYWNHLEDIGAAAGHTAKPIVGTEHHAKESGR